MTTNSLRLAEVRRGWIFYEK